MRVEIQDLSKRFFTHSALAALNAVIEPGEIVAVLGLNGAGKTTLLRCLAGLLRPSDGEIRFDGECLRRDRLDLRRRFGFLPDMPFLFPEMSVIRHIGMVLRLYEKDFDGVEERVIEILEGLDMLPFVESSIGTLSRGQAYKTGLAALRAADLDLLMCDEPFASGMDAQGMTTFKVFGREAASRGKTLIYTTQILEIAERFSTRVLIINRGELYAFDRVENLLTSPGDSLTTLFKKLREHEQPPRRKREIP